MNGCTCLQRTGQGWVPWFVVFIGGELVFPIGHPYLLQHVGLGSTWRETSTAGRLFLARLPTIGACSHWPPDLDIGGDCGVYLWPV